MLKGLIEVALPLKEVSEHSGTLVASESPRGRMSAGQTHQCPRGGTTTAATSTGPHGFRSVASGSGRSSSQPLR